MGSMRGHMVNMRLHVSGKKSKKTFWPFTLYFAMFGHVFGGAARPEDQGVHRC